MYYVCKQNLRRYIMNTFVALFKDIFSFGDNDGTKIGLSQFNKPEPQTAEPKTTPHTGEVKLSDLMRRSY